MTTVMTTTLSWSHRKQHEVAERDGWTCAYCGRPVACRCRRDEVDDVFLNAATIDHRIAQANGGGHGLDNLVLACQKCNSRKRTQPVEMSPVVHRPSDSQVRLRAWEHMQHLIDWAVDREIWFDNPLREAVTRLDYILDGTAFPPSPPGYGVNEVEE